MSDSPDEGGRPKTHRYYAVRLPLDMIKRLHDLAAEETMRIGYRVSTAELIRKFLEDGMKKLVERTHKQAIAS